jgi:DNA repair protein RadC
MDKLWILLYNIEVFCVYTTWKGVGLMADKNYPHSGHRQRLREEFSKKGFDKWDDMQILEYMLFNIIPRADTSEMARRLIKKCGNIKGVLNAPDSTLESVEGIGKNAVLYIRSLKAFVQYYNGLKSDGKMYFTDEFKDGYLHDLFQDRHRECLYEICLDARKAIIKTVLVSEGAYDSTEVDVGKVVRIAIQSEAAGVVLAHNHPGGNLEPSGADMTTTQIVRNSLRIVGILLYEHYIVTDEKIKGFVKRIERYETEKNIQKYSVKY